MSPSEKICKLSPFLLRSRSLEVGRDRLFQVRNKLLFLLATEDLSDNSLKKALLQFPCPVFQCFTSADLESLFHLYGTKLIGFRRSDLCLTVMKELSPFRLGRLRDGVLPPRPLPPHPEIAVLGTGDTAARHAFRWHQEGGIVTAFLDSGNQLSSGEKDALLRQTGTQAEFYISLEELLTAGHPHIVDVCLPPEQSGSAIRSTLEAGCHVLSPAPLLYDAETAPAELLQQAGDLVALAASGRRMLGLCSPYAPAVRKCLNMRKNQEKSPDYFDCILSVPAPAGISGDRLAPWLLLGSHALAAAQICARPGILAPEDLRFSFSPNSVTAEFSCSRPDNPRLFRGRITTSLQDSSSDPVRQIRLDSETFILHPGKTDQGLAPMTISCNEHSTPWQDPLQILIRAFLGNHMEIPPDTALNNLALLLAPR